MSARTITTREELDAMPVGSVVRYDGGTFPVAAIKNWQSKHPRKDGTPLSEWLVTGDIDAIDTGEITLPAVALWEPSIRG